VPGADTPHARAARFLQAFRDAGYTGAIASLPNPGGNRAGKPARITLQEQDLAALLQLAAQKEYADV
jgi:hypothetical protein